jgi:ABC-type multidrug transport system fused ATPase/permease subunit
MQTIKKLLFILTPQERKRAIQLLIMILIMALLDTIGIASIWPFISVITNPSLIETNVILQNLFRASSIFGVKNNQQFLFILGLLVLVLMIISLLFKTLTTYVQIRFVQMRAYSIENRLMKKYLNQPYSWFLDQNSSELAKNILTEAGHLIGGGIRPLIELIVRVCVTATILFLLFIVNPKLALLVGFSLTTVYAIIFFLTRKFLKDLGKKRLESNELRFKIISEAFGAIKEVKVRGVEKSFNINFSNTAEIFAGTTSSSQIVAQLPRFFLEIIAFGGIVLITLYLMDQAGSLNDAIPTIILYAFAGFRLMPAFQQIFFSISQLSFVGPSLDKLYDDFKNLKSKDENQDPKILSFNKTIALKNIHYNYPKSTKVFLKNINLTINAKSTVGLIGVTGSGKTSIIDIILGLLIPQKGTLEIDGKVITDQNVSSWQRSIGYVPQNIYLSDDTVAANIAFGHSPENINQDLIEKSSKIANLHEFVMDKLPKQYLTTIGERGIKLSGGERQRIGIARALYHNPQLLILDEATSALDDQMQQAVMDAIDNLDKNLTIILIAHRLVTLKKCDKIILLENGEIKKEGKFEELIKSNKNFYSVDNS